MGLTTPDVGRNWVDKYWSPTISSWSCLKCVDHNNNGILHMCWKGIIDLHMFVRMITKRHISGTLHRYHIITPKIQVEEGQDGQSGGDSDMCLNQIDVLWSALLYVPYIQCNDLVSV